MASQHPSKETLGQLALSCSALARAGQILSTVQDPSQGGKALLQAAAILEDDLRTSGWLQIGDLAAECRAAADSTSEPGMIEVCRRLATKLARQASTLATEVRQQSKRATTPAAQPAPVVPPAPIVPSPALAKPVPSAQPGEGVPLSAMEPVTQERRIRESDLARIRVAVSSQERKVVLEALEAGERFALVQGEIVIDVESNRMWLAQFGPKGPFSTALEFVATCRVGGYSDWRLPRPNELQQFVTRGGMDCATGQEKRHGQEAGAGVLTLWSGDSRWRWLLLRKEVTVVDIRTGAASSCRAGSKDVAVLAVRGGA